MKKNKNCTPATEITPQQQILAATQRAQQAVQQQSTTNIVNGGPDESISFEFLNCNRFYGMLPQNGNNSLLPKAYPISMPSGPNLIAEPSQSATPQTTQLPFTGKSQVRIKSSVMNNTEGIVVTVSEECVVTTLAHFSRIAIGNGFISMIAPRSEVIGIIENIIFRIR